MASKSMTQFRSATAAADVRVAALGGLLEEAAENDTVIPALIEVLRDRAEPQELRRGALQTLQAATFSVPGVEAFRKDYVEALREVSDDPDEVLRHRVLGVLARDKDAPTQKRLLDGLKKPEKSLVPPEKALQLLSYDSHAGAYAAAEKVVENPPNPTAKREALRLLASNATSAPLLLKTLRDKTESPEIRQMCAAALNVLNPQKFLTYARDIVLDDTDDDPDINAMSLTALTHFGNEAKLAVDDALHATVSRLKVEASAKVKKGAREFLKKYNV